MTDLTRVARVSGRRSTRSVIVDGLLALVFGLIAVGEVGTTPVGLLPAAAGIPVAIVVGIALLFRRRRTIPVLIVALLGSVLVGAVFPVLLAMYTLANRYGNRTTTWLYSALGWIAITLPWGKTWSLLGIAGHLFFMLLFLLVPVLLGLWTNQRAQVLTGLRERAEQAERERDLRAAAAVEAERIRIARELHDIVAHRISQITVLAGALEVSADGRPAEIAGTIRETGARALSEMRELLGVLRQDADLPGGQPDSRDDVPWGGIEDSTVDPTGSADSGIAAHPAGRTRWLPVRWRWWASRSRAARSASEEASAAQVHPNGPARPADSTGRFDSAAAVGSATSAGSVGSAGPAAAGSAGSAAPAMPRRWGPRSDERVPLRPAPDLHAIAELVAEAVEAGQRVDVAIAEPLPEVSGAIGRAVYRIVQEALTNAGKHAAGAEVRVRVGVRDDVLEVDVRNPRGERAAVAAQGSGFGLIGMRERVELAGGTLHSGPLSSGGFAVHAVFPLREVS